MNRMVVMAVAGAIWLAGSWQAACAADAVPGRGRPAVGGGRAAKAPPKAFDQCQRAEHLFTGKLVSAQAGPVARFLPPIHSFSLKITVAEVLRGSVKKDQRLTVQYSARQHQPPVLPVGKQCLFVADMARNGRLRVIRVDEATKAVLKTARVAASLPLGWSMKDGKVVSPWSGLKNAWPKEARPVDEQVLACAKTGRPALFCGKDVAFKVEKVPPAKAIKWTNPDGDGEYTITVTNTSEKGITVRALLSGDTGILWNESLVIICQNKVRPVPGSKGVRAKPGAVTLKAGESVSTVVNIMAMKDVTWPKGGYRVSFQFCLGELSVTKSFYYLSRHHDAVRARVQAGGGN